MFYEEQPKECNLSTMIDMVKRVSDGGDRFCFILGAGASVSSGIKSGKEMAKIWLEELCEIEPYMTEKWMSSKKDISYSINSKGIPCINSIDDVNLGKYYTELYGMRFRVHPHDGYKWLQDEMEDASPGLGYYHLAHILAAERSPINLAITTNFDTLIEDAIFMYTDKKPLVISHEYLASYMEHWVNRPIIAKIHRDLFNHPMSTEKETEQLATEWIKPLKAALSICATIVIGYDGNDGSLMNLLETIVNNKDMTKPIYWCYRRNKKPENEKIINLLIKNGGFLVPIDDFDTAMYLFGVEFGHDFPEELLKSKIQERIDAYRDNRRNIIEKKKRQEKKSPDEEKVIEAIKKSRENRLQELTNRIDKAPDSANAFCRRGDFFRITLKEYDKAVDDYKEAIERSPKNALYHYNCGLGYYSLGDYNKAIECYNTAIKFDKYNAEYYYERGVNHKYLYQSGKKYKEHLKKAITDLNTAISYDTTKNKARYYAELSFLYYKDNNLLMASDSLLMAMSEDNKNAWCYNYRGLINLIKMILKKEDDQIKLEEIKNDFEEAIRLKPGPHSCRCYTNLAMYYLYVGNYDEAHKNLDEADRIYGGYGRALFYQVQYYKKIGNKGKSNYYENELNKHKYEQDIEDKMLVEKLQI
jgi:tetratricopeptide (TPR) repeat protein